MIAQPLVVAGFMITATMAGVIDRREETSICGAPKPSEEHMKSYRALIARSAGGGIFDRQTDDDKPIEIATVIHVLAEDNTLEGGMLSVRFAPPSLRNPGQIPVSAPKLMQYFM